MCADAHSHTRTQAHTTYSHTKTKGKKVKESRDICETFIAVIGVRGHLHSTSTKQECEQQNRTEVLSLDLAQENHSECLNKGTDEAPSPEGGPGLASIVSLPLPRILLA